MALASARRYRACALCPGSALAAASPAAAPPAGREAPRRGRGGGGAGRRSRERSATGPPSPAGPAGPARPVRGPCPARRGMAGAAWPVRACRVMGTTWAGSAVPFSTASTSEAGNLLAPGWSGPTGHSTPSSTRAARSCWLTPRTADASRAVSRGPPRDPSRGRAGTSAGKRSAASPRPCRGRAYGRAVPAAQYFCSASPSGVTALRCAARNVPNVPPLAEWTKRTDLPIQRRPPRTRHSRAEGVFDGGAERAKRGIRPAQEWPGRAAGQRRNSPGPDGGATRVGSGARGGRAALQSPPFGAGPGHAGGCWKTDVTCRLATEKPRFRGALSPPQRTDMPLGDLFDSPWKILIIAAVLIVFFGSTKLPGAARSL